MGLIECYHNAHLSVLFTTVSFGTGYVHHFRSSTNKPIMQSWELEGTRTTWRDFTCTSSGGLSCVPALISPAGWPRQSLQCFISLVCKMQLVFLAATHKRYLSSAGEKPPELCRLNSLPHMAAYWGNYSAIFPPKNKGWKSQQVAVGCENQTLVSRQEA